MFVCLLQQFNALYGVYASICTSMMCNYEYSYLSYCSAAARGPRGRHLHVPPVPIRQRCTRWRRGPASARLGRGHRTPRRAPHRTPRAYSLVLLLSLYDHLLDANASDCAAITDTSIVERGRNVVSCSKGVSPEPCFNLFGCFNLCNIPSFRRRHGQTVGCWTTAGARQFR